MKKEEKIIKCLKELNTKLKYQNELVETRLYCSQLKEKRLQERISKAIDLLEEARENIDLPWYDRQHLIERTINKLRGEEDGRK